jgi:hypothetical protein
MEITAVYPNSRTVTVTVHKSDADAAIAAFYREGALYITTK